MKKLADYSIIELFEMKKYLEEKRGVYQNILNLIVIEIENRLLNLK